jgi:hypothetical protein
MNCSEAGRNGGASRSEKKRVASARNLALAREMRRNIAVTKESITQAAALGFTDKAAEKWVADGETIIALSEKVLTNLEKKPVVLR